MISGMSIYTGSGHIQRRLNQKHDDGDGENNCKKGIRCGFPHVLFGGKLNNFKQLLVQGVLLYVIPSWNLRAASAGSVAVKRTGFAMRKSGVVETGLLTLYLVLRV
jgi:hypothetical protein